ncbi:hypothetical protein RQN30_01710 [Arcanobacterium hippocoleae]
MSETPRLTRRQLREMGKLVAKPEDAPALTDTQELRLRRPSRKELREAERVERERNEALILQGAAEKEARENGELPQVPENLMKSRSVNQYLIVSSLNLIRKQIKILELILLREILD